MKQRLDGANIGMTVEESTKNYTSSPRVDNRAPNVVVVYMDDMGYSDLGCFGSEIKTPNIDLLASGGLRFTNYTSHPICSPARAALLTGKNAHRVATGFLSNTDGGYPGYRGEIPSCTTTLAEYLRGIGYATFMVGKWHNTNYANSFPSSDKGSWPCQRGFDHFYGFLGGDCSYFFPARIVQDNTLIETETYPTDYYATDDWTTHAIRMISDHVSHEATKPFLLYAAYNAPHAPLQAKPEDIEKYAGVYSDGWDVAAERRKHRQVELGLFPEAILKDRQVFKPTWSECSEAEQRLFARYMQVYAAMIDSVDQNIGRLVAHLKSIGAYHNTIFLIASDNGAASGGGERGMLFSSRRFSGLDDIPDVMQQVDDLGSGKFDPVYPNAWAQVSNTPFREFKTQTGGGGRRVPFIMSWPAGIPYQGATRDQFIHVTDLFPTIAEMIDTTQDWSFVQSRPADFDGMSFLATAVSSAPSERTQQYYECWSNRAYQREEWIAISTQTRGAPVDLGNWRLYRLADDITESRDLAPNFPEKTLDLSGRFDLEARRNKVYPLDNRSATKRFNEIPDYLAQSYGRAKTFFRESDSVHHSLVMPMIYDRSFTITAEFDFTRGDRGVIWALGDGFAGIVMFVTDDFVCTHYNGHGQFAELDPVSLSQGHQRVDFQFRSLGSRKGEAEVRLCNGQRSRLHQLYPTIMSGSLEGLDVGIDRRGPVSWRVYEKYGAFPYTSTIQYVTVAPGDAPVS